MGRTRLRLAMIVHEKARSKAFMKRMKCLEKKAWELSTLCGVGIGMIVYGPTSSSGRNEPWIWPRDEELMSRMIESYKKSKSGNPEGSRTYDLSAFFRDETERTKEEIKKLRKKRREAWCLQLEEMANTLSEDELKGFAAILMGKIDDVRGRIHMLKGAAAAMIPLLPPQPEILMNMNSSEAVQESKSAFVPNVWTFETQLQPQHRACYDAQAGMADQRLMMNHDEGSGIRDVFFLGEDHRNYGYVFQENPAEGYVAAMENIVAENNKQMRSHYLLDVMPQMLPLNSPSILPSLACQLHMQDFQYGGHSPGL